MGLKGFKACEPLGDYITVVLHEHKQSAGGIIVPETASQSVPPWVEVIAVGPDVKLRRSTGDAPGKHLEPGDCLYARIGATLMRISLDGYDDRETYIVREDQIVAYVEPPEAGNGLSVASAEQVGALATVTSTETADDAPAPLEDFPPLVLS